MTIKVQDERKGSKNYVNTNILECVKFWNKEGKDIYSKNITGDLGSKETNELARTKSYHDFVLDMLVIDCKTFINSNIAKESGINFEVGRTMSHLWYHEDDDRKLIIYVENIW